MVMVESLAVFSKNFGRDFFVGLKNFVGVELKGYSEMLEMIKILPFQN